MQKLSIFFLLTLFILGCKSEHHNHDHDHHQDAEMKSAQTSIEEEVPEAAPCDSEEEVKEQLNGDDQSEEGDEEAFSFEKKSKTGCSPE